MHKNKNIISGILLIITIVMFIPFSLVAEENGETEKAEDEPLQEGVLWKYIKLTKSPFKNVTPLLGLIGKILLKLLPLIFVIMIIKVWLLKRRLNITWNFKLIEKLTITTISQITVELLFLFILMTLFAPAIFSIFKNSAFIAATSEGSYLLKLIFTTLLVLPYHCIIGGMLGLLLIYLLTLKDIDVLKKHIKFTVLMSLMTPIALIIFTFFIRVILKSDYI